MLSWWRRFAGMPDRERAQVLAAALAAVVLLILYSLGGLSLYLRARYLKPTPAPIASVGSPVDQGTPTLTIAPSATPSLYPTITPFRIEQSGSGELGDGPATGSVLPGDAPRDAATPSQVAVRTGSSTEAVPQAQAPTLAAVATRELPTPMAATADALPRRPDR